MAERSRRTRAASFSDRLIRRSVSSIGLPPALLDRRTPGLIEHSMRTLWGQRIFAIALGYEDLNDHDELRHDPLMATLAGKLESRR